MRRIAFIACFVCMGPLAAQAQNAPTATQIQAQIAAGQETQALSELNTVLQAHPKSGKAWYLVAEAQDASGNPAGARGALALAQQYAPGLPFAKPSDAAALQAHLAQPAATAPAARPGISPLVIIGGVIFVLFLLARMFFRRRPSYPVGYGPGYGPGFNGNPPGPYPYGQGGPGYGGGYGGGGIGGSLLTGLAAGAGLAAGERAIDGMFGNRGGGFDPSQNPGGGNVPGWDDGLNNSPGWDNSTPDDSNNDPGGGW